MLQMSVAAEIIMIESMKTIEVVAAIIIEDGKLFATQRGYGEWKDWWEFPGGKIEGTFVNENEDENEDDGGNCSKWIPVESPQDALKREIREELQTEIEVGELLTVVEYDYPKFHLSMQCYLCSVISGGLSLLEHEDARWLGMDELDSVRWLPADLEILPLIAARL